MSVSKLSNFSTGPYNGRDKIAKITQFTAKLFAYHLLLNDPKSVLGQQLVYYDKNVAMSRKGMRLGKSIELYQKLTLVMKKDMPQFDFALEVISNVGMMFRWAYDNLSFLEKAKILDKRDYGVTSNKYRVFATFAYIIIALKKINKANEAIAAAKDNETKSKGRKAQYEAVLELIGRVADLCNAAHSAKMYQTNESIQGMAGIISAYVALRKVWNATKA